MKSVRLFALFLLALALVLPCLYLPWYCQHREEAHQWLSPGEPPLGDGFRGPENLHSTFLSVEVLLIAVGGGLLASTRKRKAAAN
jgi:hypothetical protein